MKLISNVKLVAVVIVIILFLLSTSLGVSAAEEPVKPAVAAQYTVVDSLKVEVKSVLNEQTAEGTRIGVVFYLVNQGNRISGLPEYEIRVKTNDKIVYTVRPSAANADAILPKEKVELTYMVVVNREDPFTLTELSWVDVNQTVYPVTEKTKLTIPISGMEWNGDTAAITQPEQKKMWGEAFTVPTFSNSLSFKPINVFKQNTSKNNAVIITLLAENKGNLNQKIPDFQIDGKSSKHIYHGKRIEEDKIILEPGEKQYLHYAIPMEQREDLLSINVLTRESFTADKDKATIVDYTIGRVNIQLPSVGNVWYQASAYERTKLIQIDSLSKLIPSNVSVSLDELHMHESDGAQYKTIVAKFKLQNQGDSPVTIPSFITELLNFKGSSYLGTRQSMTIDSLIPNLNYVLYYYFVVPSSEDGDKLVMRVLDGQTAAPYYIPLASLRTKIQEDSYANTDLHLYPFEVKLNNWKIETKFESGSWSYSNQLTLDMNILQGQSVIDQNFSKLRVEVTNKEGKVRASELFPLTGPDRLIKGDRSISFVTPVFEYDYYVKFYEAVDTPFGEVKRLVGTVQR